jgi:ABC-2 type transport system ATP-binding protein
VTATEFALRTDGVGKRYRRGWALRDCTLALPAGGVIALVGPNGAGKTTLLRLVVGLLAPSTGTVEVLGHDVTASTPQTLSRVGFLAQDHPLYKRFTVAEMLRFGRACNLRFDQGLAERRLAKLGIPLDRRAGTLSGGQQAVRLVGRAACRRSHVVEGRSHQYEGRPDA